MQIDCKYRRNRSILDVNLALEKTTCNFRFPSKSSDPVKAAQMTDFLSQGRKKSAFLRPDDWNPLVETSLKSANFDFVILGTGISASNEQVLHVRLEVVRFTNMTNWADWQKQFMLIHEMICMILRTNSIWKCREKSSYWRYIYITTMLRLLRAFCQCIIIISIISYYNSLIYIALL